MAGITAFQVISAAISAVGVVGGFLGGKKQAKFSAQGAKARKEGADITAARGQIDDRFARRQKTREERVRRAQIVASAEGAGVTGSSGAIGAISVLGTNTGGAIAGSLGAAKARQGVGQANQAAANATASQQQSASQANLFAAGIGAFQTGLDLTKDFDIFSSSPTGGGAGGTSLP